MVLESRVTKENKPHEIIRLNTKDINDRTKFHDLYDAILLWFCNSHYGHIASLHDAHPITSNQSRIIGSFNYGNSFWGYFKDNFKHLAPITASPISCGEELIGTFRNVEN